MSNIFKICLSASVLAHTALIVPYHFRQMPEKPEVKEPVELNYVIIERPRLVQEKEIYGNKEIERARDYHQSTGVSELQSVEMPEERQSVTASQCQQEAFLEYFNLIREKVRAKIHRNLGSKAGGGTVTLLFTLTPDGRIRRVASDIGRPESRLNVKAVKGLEEAQPFPPFPAEMGTEPLNFSLTIRFK